MGTKFNFLYLKTFLLLLYLLPANIIAQDSLYLIGTITGESYDKRITNVSRVGDVNGDGYDDFMVASRTGKTSSDQGIVQLYLGSATFDLIPDMALHYPGADILNNGIDAFEIGDVNNDGYDDFAIQGIFGDYSGFPKGKVFLYYGGTDIDTIPIAEFYESWIQDYFGSVVEKVGDLNKDGYDDFTVSSTYNWSNGKGYVYLFWGGDTISWEKSITFTSDSLGDGFGESVANIGDINDDGFDDIGIGAPSDDSGKVYIYDGNNVGETIVKDIIIGGNIFRLDDINGDSIIEFAVNIGQMKVYLSLDSNICFGKYFSSLGKGELNGDDYGDFITGNTTYRNSDNIMVGGAFVYFGKKTIDTIYSITLEGENKWDEFSRIISITDINGDGYDELFILAPNYPDYNNPQGKIYIYSYKNLTAIEDHKENGPNNFKLNQNYPNPFNPTTNIQFSIPTTSFVTLIVYDVLGKKIETLINSELAKGKHSVSFDGSMLSSGCYIYQLKADGYLINKKMLLLR